MFKFAAILTALVLLCLGAATLPVHAQEPPQQTGKEDSTVSPLLREFIERRESSAIQLDVQPAVGAGTRSQPDDGLLTRDAPAADGGQPESVTRDDPVRFDDSGNVQVYIRLQKTDAATMQQLRDLGGVIEITNTDWNIVQAWVPIPVLDLIAALDAVQRVTPPDYAVTNAGSATTEGDAVHRSDLVRSLSGLTGAGVKVGVISDGADSYRRSISSRDLPSSVEINPNNRGEGDEGTAMMEIVHDLAPGAQLAFFGLSTGGTSLDMVEGILWLANDAFEGAGADIIVDDLGFYQQPYFEDGYVAEAAADAVAGGAVYVSHAGNNASAHYEAQFSDGGDGFHDFDASGATDISLRIYLAFGTSVFLQWNDRFGESDNDYDLYVCQWARKPTKFNLQNGGGRICKGSTEEQDGDDDPIEVVHFTGTGEADVYIRKRGGDAKTLELFALGSRVIVAEHGVREGSIVGHPAVAGVLAAGAIDVNDPGNDDPQDVSSRGPSEIYFPSRATRNKPDVMGMDGVSTTGPGGRFNPFSGTSAAAPHVAGIAALVMEAQRVATPSATRKAVAEVVRQKLRDTAIDLGYTGHDNTTGYGRADALAAIESIASASDAFSLHSITGFPATYTVDSTGDGADSSTSDGVCDDGNGSCTLRAAIGQANAGTGAVINFNIPGSGARTINPASALPAITKPVFIDGYSQPGASAGTVLIELAGTSAGMDTNGLILSGKGSYVRGLAVNSFDGNGIVLQGNSGGQVLLGNMLGTDTAGSIDQGNGAAGVYINGAPSVVLRDNVISSNTTYGVHVNGAGATGAVLYGNKVGTNAAGTSDLGNAAAGVHVNGAREVALRDNVISGNDTHGISLSGSATGAAIEYNRIGTSDAGNTDLGNTGSGIHISGTREAKIYENVIGFNDSHGISLTGGGTYDTIIAENRIGANSGGMALGNGGSGVHNGDGARNNEVVANTIANNGGDGVTVVSDDATGNRIEKNSIHDNVGLGIDLGDDGITANDTDDSDSGPNNLQNYPTIVNYAHGGGVVSVNFTLYHSEDVYRFDFYSCDSSTSGEGKQWLAAAVASTVDVGSQTYTAGTLTLTLGVADVSMSTVTHVTATATSDSTSEFSPCVAPVALPELDISDRFIDVREGSTATYTVALSPAPSSETEVKLFAWNTRVATVLPDTLTFAANEGTGQTVTVTGVADDDADTGVTDIWHAVGDYQHVAARVPVQVMDDEVPVLTLASTHAAATFPGDVSVGHFYDGHIGSPDNPFAKGTTATYTVVLDAEPPGDVTIDLESTDTDALTISPTSITFTRTGEASAPNKFEWDSAQTVTLAAESDSDLAVYFEVISHGMTIGEKDYVLGQVQAVILDLGLPGLTYSPDTREVTIASEAATATYTIVPASEPSSDLTVNLFSSDEASVTVSPPSLSFTVGTSGDWRTPKTVTVAGVADDDEFDDQAYIRHRTTFDGKEYIFGSVLVTVTDSNRAPFFEDGLKTTRSIDENSGPGTAVGDPVVVTDLNNDTLDYSIGEQEGGPYTVDSGTGQIRVGAGATLDYERRTNQEVTLRVTDEDGLSDTIEVGIEIVDVNEPPVISGDGSPTFNENANINNRVARYTAADPERDPFEWSVGGTDASAFTIDTSGSLKFNIRPDHEDKDEYSITIVATDDGDPPNAGEYAVTVEVGDVNEPPVIIGVTVIDDYDENGTGDVATYTAMDPEGDRDITWSLGGADRGDFGITGGVLAFKSVPDYERPVDSGGNNEYLVQIRASDGQDTGTLDVMVTVNNVNEAPTLTGDSTVSYAENGTRPVATYRAEDPERGMVTWSLSGDDLGDFDLSETGVLTFANVPDFEMPADANGDNEYLVTVEAGDEDSNAATLAVTVTVTNAPGPEEPTITTTGNPSPYRENGTGVVYTFRATDPQGGPLTWSLEGADANDFDITSDGGVLTFASPPDFEDPTDADRDNTYEIRVVVTDEQGLVDRVDVTITVANDPEGVEPTISTRSPPATYGENGTSTVYTFRATDPQGGSIAWELGGADAGAFGLSETGALTFGSPPDFENPSDVGDDNEYNLTVSATDEDGHSDRVSFTTTVTDVNEGPEVTRIGGAPGSVAESDDPAQVLARYTATDPEDPTAVITLWSTSGTDGGDFVMNAQGELRFRTQPDHERPADSNRDNVYVLMVRASDGRNFGTFDETVTVSNVEEPGMVTFSASAPVVNRQLNARLADPDGNVQSPAWEWESSPDGSTDWNFISGATSDSYTPAAEDMGRYLRAMVRYEDGEGSGKRAEGITANPVQATPPPPPITGGGGGGGPVNRAPEFLDAGDDAITETTRVIAEDAVPGTNIGEPVAATDPDEDTLTYTVSGGDTASFEIDASTGQLTTATALDHEAKASYTVTVIATDPSGAAAEIQVTITVTEVVFDCSTGNAVVDAADHPDLVADCEALLAARDKLAGSATLNWSEDTPITGWDGVILGETPRRVTQLYLVRKSLGGTIPADLGSLSRLTGLYLHRNELTGPIPPQLGELSSLVHLTLHRNQLSGEVPGELGDLTELTFLSLYGNKFTGELPEELGGLSNLRWLYLHSNKTADGGGLSGPIPDAFGDLRNLERLMLYGNSLSGEIPTELGQLSNLKSLLLHDNEFTGQIPAELGGLPGLRYLWLDDNDLSGPIPSELGGLSNLRWLSLYGNGLSGAIPGELGDLSGLRLLILDRNDLSGAIPTSLGELSELTWLDLNDNDLSGPIPGSLGDLSNLEHLYLHNNELTGPVPADLGRLTNLTNLWLRDNRLSGQVPPSLGDLPNLQRVRIAGNAFTGCLPDGLLGEPSWYSDAGELGLPACGG